MAIISKNLQNKLDNLKINLQIFVDATGRNPTTEEAKEIMETGSADSVLQKLQNTANTAKPIDKMEQVAKSIAAFKEQYGREPNSEEAKQLIQQTTEPAQESSGGNGLLIGGLAVGILGIILLTRGGGKKRK